MNYEDPCYAFINVLRMDFTSIDSPEQEMEKKWISIKQML